MYRLVEIDCVSDLIDYSDSDIKFTYYEASEHETVEEAYEQLRVLQEDYPSMRMAVIDGDDKIIEEIK